MWRWLISAVVAVVGLGAGRPVFAQASLASRVFVDGALAVERDPTDYFDGTDQGTAGRAAFGLHVSRNNSIRFEVDVPRWRVQNVSYSGPTWCAGLTCVNGDGFVPSRTTSRTEVRTVSSSVLYARHFPSMGRVRLALVAGGSVEARSYRASGSFEQLGPDGRLLTGNTWDTGHTKYWPAIVVGGDAEVRVASHLVVVPQFRFHTFPYPAVSIVRTGVALRWTF